MRLVTLEQNKRMEGELLINLLRAETSGPRLHSDFALLRTLKTLRMRNPLPVSPSLPGAVWLLGRRSLSGLAIGYVEKLRKYEQQLML